MAQRGTLILRVKVKTPEDCEQLIGWLYSKEPPLTSELLEISWDKELVSAKEALALQAFRDAVLNP